VLSDVNRESRVERGLSALDYHSRSGVLSSSGARLLLPPSCPALFRYRMEHPQYSDEFDLGHAAHKLVLGDGPEIVRLDFDDRRTSAAKKAIAEARAAGQVPLLADDFARVHEMAAAIRMHPIAGPLFDPGSEGDTELSLFWPDRSTGVPCRARPDRTTFAADGRLVITDYKTTVSAAPAAIERSIASYGYHCQADWYLDGARAALGEKGVFLLVFQEKTAPYLVTVVEIEAQALEIAQERNRRARRIFAECRESGIWPGYVDDIAYLGVPAWEYRRHEEEYA
jgi:hypothetical protein